jgi:tetratricopeptide (TPR) repeat protein
VTGRGRAAAAVLIVACAAGAAIARARLAAYPEASASKDLLYLPNGRYLRALSLGQAPVLADALYLWAIQYYSDYDRADRYRYVEHVFGSVITEINPYDVDPYWLGAMILNTEVGDLEAGLRLLDRGFARNPGQWVLPYMAAWDCYHAGQYGRAASYFDRAARVPGAPGALLRMRAGMFAKEGDYREAIRQWQAVLDQSNADAASRAIAERQIRDLTVRADLQDLDRAVATYRERFGRGPQRLEDLAATGIVPFLPIDPEGKPYAFDRRTGRVTSSAGRVLYGS